MIYDFFDNPEPVGSDAEHRAFCLRLQSAYTALEDGVSWRDERGEEISPWVTVFCPPLPNRPHGLHRLDVDFLVHPLEPGPMTEAMQALSERAHAKAMGRARGRKPGATTRTVAWRVQVSANTAARLNKGESFVAQIGPAPEHPAVAELERLRSQLPPARGEGGVGQGSWSVFAEQVVAERDAARAALRALAVQHAKAVRVAWMDLPGTSPSRAPSGSDWRCSRSREALWETLRGVGQLEEADMAALVDGEVDRG